MWEPIEKSYFNWLCAKVLEDDSQDYASLMVILYETEFVWVLHEDTHRVADAIELRENFLRETESNGGEILDQRPCSIFELLLSFADRASFQTDIPTKDWFWEFIANLRLDIYRTVSKREEAKIQDVLNTFTWRRYAPNGLGGLFPLASTDEDQTKVELWYQFFAYLTDRGL